MQPDPCLRACSKAPKRLATLLSPPSLGNPTDQLLGFQLQLALPESARQAFVFIDLDLAFLSNGNTKPLTIPFGPPRFCPHDKPVSIHFHGPASSYAVNGSSPRRPFDGGDMKKESVHDEGFDLSDALAMPETPQRNKEKGRCPNDARDIIFVIDGSSSMRSPEFMHLKEFVSLTMKNFPNNTQFSLLQFSSRFQEHFDFKQFHRNPDPDQLLSQVKQLGGSSHTASAIRKAIRDLFVSHRGARHTATKILVVVTDGLKTGDPIGYPEAVEEAERAGVVRIAVGVGLGFISTVAQQELQAIASAPATEHMFHVRHFTDLRNTPHQLREKICSRRGPAVPQPHIPPQSPDTCAAHSDPQVLQKLERVLSSLDAISAKLDSLAIRQGKCGRDSHLLS